MQRDEVGHVTIPCNAKMRSELNDEQTAAVEAPLTNVCINAIAGSGKTRVLTYRVANLIDNGYAESEMILLTFTTKASQEMTARIKEILETDKLQLMSGTFHGVASQILRKYAKALGISETFSVLEGYRQRGLIDNCRKEMIKSYEGEESNFPSASLLVEIYSGAINHDIPFVEYIKNNYNWITETQIDEIITLFRDYIDRKQEEGLLDFDDLLIKFYDLLHDYPDIREEITERFKYIFVDEYQDINQLQFDILKLLNKNNTLFAIGDTAQCIYQFRGSKDEYIEQFSEHYPEACIYNLSYNYRSDGAILKLAEAVINKNQYNRYIECNTVNDQGEKPSVFACKDGETEAETIAAQIIEAVQSGYFQFSDIAIIVRKMSQATILHSVFNKYHIPYGSGGERNLYEERYMKGLLSLVGIVANPKDETNMQQALRLCPYITQEKAADIYSTFKKNNFDFEKTIFELTGDKQRAMEKIRDIYMFKAENVSRLIKYIMDTMYEKYLLRNTENAQDKISEIQSLINTTGSIANVSAFLDIISLSKNSQLRDKGNHVSIMTIHKSKGLEWDMVIIPCLAKGEFPKCRPRDYTSNAKNVRDERNLLYVGITRARYSLIMTYAKTYGDKKAGPSYFIEEIKNDGSDLFDFIE